MINDRKYRDGNKILEVRRKDNFESPSVKVRPNVIALSHWQSTDEETTGKDLGIGWLSTKQEKEVEKSQEEASSLYFLALQSTTTLSFCVVLTINCNEIECKK